MSTLSDEIDKLRHRTGISVAAYHQMIKNGVLTLDGRVELLDGELVQMSPMGPDHATQVEKLTRFLLRQVINNDLEEVRVRPQLPLILNDNSEVHPDFVLLSEPDKPGQNPHAAHALLVIEISDTTLRDDREKKLPRYAASGVPEVWIVDLANKQDPKVVAYRAPEHGQYTQVSEHKVGEIAPQKIPGLSITVEHFLLPGHRRAPARGK